MKHIPTKILLLLLMNANAGTGTRIEGCDDGRVLGAYGRDESNNNGKRLSLLASDNKLALTNTFFSVRKGGLSHTFNGINSRDDRKRIDYILARQAHRLRVYDVKVYIQPPSLAKTDSDHDTRWSVSAVVLLPTDAYVQKTKSSLSTGRSFDLTEIADSE